jgi:cytochrome c
MKVLITLCGASLLAVTNMSAHTVPDVLATIDPATDKPKDTATAFGLTAIVSARATLPDGRILAFMHPEGQRGVPILVAQADGANVQPRNELTLTGTLQEGPFGWAVLAVKEGSISVGATNKPFGLSEARDAAFFKDPASLAGRWVQITNVAFAPGKLSAKAPVKVAGEDGTEVKLLVSAAVEGRDAPTERANVFGIPVKVNGEWHLLAGRFLSANGKAMQALAEKRTCLSCHNPDVLKVGPAYRDVAARYRNDPAAVATFIALMENGGTGKWGTNTMVPLKMLVPPPEMKQLAEWVLSYKWDAILAE